MNAGMKRRRRRKKEVGQLSSTHAPRPQTLKEKKIKAFAQIMRQT